MTRSTLRALAHLALAVVLGATGIGAQAAALTFGTGGTLEVNPTEVVLPALPTVLPARDLFPAPSDVEGAPPKIPTPFILSVRGPRPPKDDFLEALLDYAYVPGPTALQINIVVPEDRNGDFEGLVASLEQRRPGLDVEVMLAFVTPDKITCGSSECVALPPAADGSRVAYYFGLFDWANWANWAASPYVYSLVNTGAMLYLDARGHVPLDIDPAFGDGSVRLAYAVRSFEFEADDDDRLTSARFVGVSQIPEPGTLLLAAGALGALASVRRRRTT